MLAVYDLIHFDWSPVHYRKCSEAQLIKECFAFQHSPQAGVFPPFPRPLRGMYLNRHESLALHKR